MTPKAKKMILLSPLFFLGAAVFIALGGVIVMALWNWLLPPLFGINQIGFWQAFGLLLLCRILFGGFGMSGSHGSHSRRSASERIADRVAERVSERLGERWDNMTPEERERFRQRMRERWGTAPSGGETTPL